MRPSTAEDRIRAARLVAIVRVSDADLAERAARCLFDNGVAVLEVSQTMPQAREALRRAVAAAPPWATVGAGTVRGVEAARDALADGAAFLIAPDANPRVAGWAADHDVLYVPGVFTPGEVSAALDAGARLLKVFPAGALGPTYLRLLSGPFPGVGFVAVGGVRPDDLRDYLDAGAVAVALGGALVDDATAADPVRLATIARACVAAAAPPSPSTPPVPSAPSTSDASTPDTRS